LLIIGGALDDPGYLEVIESLGASVVADQLCWGSKTFSEQAVEGMSMGSFASGSSSAICGAARWKCCGTR